MGMLCAMAAQTIRERILEGLKALPLDATYDDAIDAIVLLAKIDEGLAELDRGEGVTQEEARRRLRM